MRQQMRIVVLVGLVIGSQPGIDDAFGSEPKESGYIAGLKPNQMCIRDRIDVHDDMLPMNGSTLIFCCLAQR